MSLATSLGRDSPPWQGLLENPSPPPHVYTLGHFASGIVKSTHQSISSDLDLLGYCLRCF